MGVPERLVEVREKYGYTRQRLADELKKPYRTITKYETGEREPGHSYIVEIAKKFGVTTDYILGLSESMVPEIKGAPPLSDEAKRILDVYDSLDEHGQRMVEVVAAEEQARLDSAKRPAAKKPTPPPVEVAGPAVEPDYRQMPFAAHGPVPEAYTEEEGVAVEGFQREVARRKHAKKND